MGVSIPANATPIAPLWGVGVGGSPVVVPPSSFGPGGSVPHVGVTLQIPLPETQPIPDAHEFSPLGQVGTNVANAVLPIEIPGTLTEIPSDSMGVIRGFTLYISDMLTTTNVTWSLMINGASPQGYNQVTMFPRGAPFVSNAIGELVRFNGPARISVVFNNIDGGTYVVGASYSGWYWPTASDARWKRIGS